MLFLFFKRKCPPVGCNGRGQQQTGQQLLTRGDIAGRVKEYRDTRVNDLRLMALLGYERLAFGSIADCIQLLYMEAPTLQRLEAMDLFMISEIKKPKDGAMEIKFFDRIKALEKLSEAQEDTHEKSLPFYRALERSADMLSNSGVDNDAE